MLVVGLTGGIASGKSTVAKYFAEWGVPVIDADLIARELVEPGLPALACIVERFGVEVLNEHGKLNRRRMRRILFQDEPRRREVEAILHPLVRREMADRITQIDAPYCLLVIPLLLESGQCDLVHRILVVDAPEELQTKRLLARDGISHAQCAAMLRAQARRSARLAAADDVICNDTDLATLRRSVKRLHRHYLRMAGQASDTS
jgi:dephospho-CoA kinase